MSRECGNECPTLLGWNAWCCRPAGHDGRHESADFYWLPGDSRASLKERPA